VSVTRVLRLPGLEAHRIDRSVGVQSWPQRACFAPAASNRGDTIVSSTNSSRASNALRFTAPIMRPSLARAMDRNEDAAVAAQQEFGLFRPLAQALQHRTVAADAKLPLGVGNPRRAMPGAEVAIAGAG
jgi:hypothetical protein